MLKLNVEIEGKDQSDLELAIGEVTRLVCDGFLSGRAS